MSQPNRAPTIEEPTAATPPSIPEVRAANGDTVVNGVRYANADEVRKAMRRFERDHSDLIKGLAK